MRVVPTAGGRRDLRALSASVVVACGALAGCGSDDETSSARFVERTVYFYKGENPTKETMRGSFDWDALEGEAIGSAFRMAQIGDDCYRRLGRKPWRKIPVGDVDRLCDPAVFADPRTQFALFREIAGDFRELGRERVRDIETTQYRGRLNIGGLKGSIEFWVDENDVVRKRRQADGDSNDGFTSIREYFDFGVDVDVAAPERFGVGG